MEVRLDQQYDESFKCQAYQSVVSPKLQQLKVRDFKKDVRSLLKRNKQAMSYTVRWAVLLCLLMLAILPRFAQPVKNPEIIVSPEAIYTAENNMGIQIEMLGLTNSFLIEITRDV